jgi:hypothetical protein
LPYDVDRLGQDGLEYSGNPTHDAGINAMARQNNLGSVPVPPQGAVRKLIFNGWQQEIAGQAQDAA